MRIEKGEGKLRDGAFLTRLRRDKRGNVIAVMAMSLIPVSALAGSAVDMARLYVVKARLQQACDAGALAGRKFMKEGDGTTLDADAKKHAETFFGNNFKQGWMGTKTVTFVPTKTSSNRVTGAAAATVPMSIMKMFAVGDVALNVTCEARFDIADTDVIFVLDTTGSMACAPGDDTTTCTNYVNSAAEISYSRPSASAKNVTLGYAGTTGWKVTEKSGSRIAALRKAVIEFHKAMAAAKQPTTKVRYGFVTYTSTVNAGAAIMAMSPGYMVGGSGTATWTYQTRRPTSDYVISEEAADKRTYNAKTQANCTGGQQSRVPAAALTYDSGSGQGSRIFEKWFGDASKCGTVRQVIGPVWTYDERAVDVGEYVTSASALDPTKAKVSRSAWLGCIEERDTTAAVSSFDYNNLPADLNPDLLPSSATNRWRPLWPDVTYQRVVNSGGANYYTRGAITTNGDDDFYGRNMNTDARQQSGNVSCGKPIQRLEELTETQVSNYVNAADFAPLGGTYHDVGMIWGLRMFSRTGIFAADNATPVNRNAPKRVIVFLTDGDMSPSQLLYGLYGMELWDERVGDGDAGKLKAFHNARFLALCAKAAQMRIDVWTVALGTGKTSELTQCASAADQALASTSGDDLAEQFKKIAKAVALLRISK